MANSTIVRFEIKGKCSVDVLSIGARVRVCERRSLSASVVCVRVCACLCVCVGACVRVGVWAYTCL